MRMTMEINKIYLLRKMRGTSTKILKILTLITASHKWWWWWSCQFRFKFWMGNMLRLNRTQVCQSLQGMFRAKHVSLKRDLLSKFINYRSINCFSCTRRQGMLLQFDVRISQYGELILLTLIGPIKLLLFLSGNVELHFHHQWSKDL